MCCAAACGVAPNLFYVEEILGVEGDGRGRHRNILIQRTAVADVGPHSKRNRFGLKDHSYILYQLMELHSWTDVKLQGFVSASASLDGYLGSLQLNGGLLLPVLAALSRSLALAWALALDLGLHVPLLLKGDI